MARFISPRAGLVFAVLCTASTLAACGGGRRRFVVAEHWWREHHSDNDGHAVAYAVAYA